MNSPLNSSSQFAYGLKDLRSLKEQLYAAAEYLEASYEQAEQKKPVVESSKDYLAKAIVTTVDHLGCVADNLTIFLDQTAIKFSATSTRFTCLQQRVEACHEFTSFRGVSQFKLISDTKSHHKQYTNAATNSDLPSSSPSITPVTNTLSISKELQQIKIAEINYLPNSIFVSLTECTSWSGINSPAEAFQMTRRKPEKRQLREENPGGQPSPNPPRFAFTASNCTPNKSSVKRSISPFRFSIQRSGSGGNRSISPNLSDKAPAKAALPSERRRSISAPRRRETRKTEKEMDPETSYPKKSMHLFKTMLRVHNKH